MNLGHVQDYAERNHDEMFAPAERVADAVLYEGYVLYPYRASAAKNRYRWQFGVLAPRAPEDAGEPWFSHTECLIEGADAPELFVRVRCLRPRATATDWLDGVPSAIDLIPIDLSHLPVKGEVSLSHFGVVAAAMIEAERFGAYIRLRLRLENREPWLAAFAADRDAMLQRCLVGTHLLLAIEDGAFVSLLEPADEAAPAVAACQNRHTWPVLVGDGDRRLMLSSPIVLYDYPAVAPESRGDLCDAAEIDEILSLRILTMTDEEKREARATDPRAREILDRIEMMLPDDLAALHGRLRNADFFNPPGTPRPEDAFVIVGGRRVAKGSRVRLRPNRRADAMDMFLNNQPATVAGVYRDVDGRDYVAVTVDADPAASLHESFGRFFYFDPGEIDPLDVQQECL